MNTVWSEDADRILSVGHWLESSGVRNWALRRELAIGAIDGLSQLGIGILGTDVYRLNNEGANLSYDSWWSERIPGEEAEAFVVRSIEEALRFVQDYSPESSDVAFAIIPDV